MGTERHPKIPFAPDGFCRRCRKPVVKPKRNWCSQKCIDDALIESRGSAARQAVFERDHGICSDCGFNAVIWQGRLDAARRLDMALIRLECSLCGTELPTDAFAYPKTLRCPEDGGSYRCSRYIHHRQAVINELVTNHRFIAKTLGRFLLDGSVHLWEADHIVPVVEGGGGCGLEGYRTLCVPCHKTHTAALARRSIHRRKMEGKYKP